MMSKLIKLVINKKNKGLAWGLLLF